MRILYDSKQPQYKTPFGTVTPEDVCTINIQIPSTVAATGVECIVTYENGDHAFNVPLTYKMKRAPTRLIRVGSPSKNPAFTSIISSSTSATAASASSRKATTPTWSPATCGS